MLCFSCKGFYLIKGMECKCVEGRSTSGNYMTSPAGGDHLQPRVVVYSSPTPPLLSPLFAIKSPFSFQRHEKERPCIYIVILSILHQYAGNFRIAPQRSRGSSPGWIVDCCASSTSSHTPHWPPSPPAWPPARTETQPGWRWGCPRRNRCAGTVHRSTTSHPPPHTLCREKDRESE